MVFVNRLSPYIFRTHLGDLDISPRWYGLAYVVGFLIALAALRRAAKSESIPGLVPQRVESLLYWLIGGVIVGGRLGFVVQNLDMLAKDPMFPFKVYEGGMAFFGGLGGVVIATWIFCRRYGIGFAALGDVLTVPAALGLGIGRIANFINGELWGVPTQAGWGVVYPKSGTEDPRHPSELYEMATHFALAAVIAIAGRTACGSRKGAASALFVLVYGLLRIVTERFRTADTYVGPLTNGQVASIVIAIVGGVWLYAVVRRKETEKSIDSFDPGS